MIRDILAAALLLSGFFFIAVAAIGVFRLPDPFLRMHASTKAGTLGAGLIVLGAAFAYTEDPLWIEAVVIVVFLLATVPIAGHLLGRATYVSGAAFEVGETGDALDGVLERADASLEQRLLARDDETERLPGMMEERAKQPAER